MKNSISKRLILYFTITLLVFAIIIGAVFAFLFVNNTNEHNKKDMEKRANKIAENMAFFLEGGSISDGEHQGQGQGQGQGQRRNSGQGGYGAFLKLVDNMTIGEVWIVDRDTNVITRRENTEEISSESLPPDGEKLISTALNGTTGFSESFSNFLDEKTMTVCVPVVSSSGEIPAAVLLHAPIDGMKESLNSGLFILVVSIIIALVLSIVIALILSRKFTKPISAMNRVAKKMIDADYRQQTGIVQNDEIGELAQTLDTLSERLLLSTEKLERMEKERQDFYADISHELRTPITILRGSLESLKDEKIPEAQKYEYYMQMIRETEQLKNMVNDLLDLSKLRSPDYKISKEPLNLSDVLSDAVRSMRNIAKEKNITLDLKNVPPVMEYTGDYEKIRQMFSIILDNAIKFSDERSEVTVSTETSHEGISVFIEDKGMGISENDLPYIFDRFHKKDSAQNSSGTGIGLAIVKQIGDKHNIKIDVESTQGVGTCFALRF